MADTGKRYRTSCTGLALETAEKHASPQDITLYGACFCPFVQRVWVALEHLQIPYQYVEIDPYAKPKELLEISPKGLVPAIKLNAPASTLRSLNESTAIVEFLIDSADNEREEHATTASGGAATRPALLPPRSDPYARALIRLQCDHINRTLVPSFYRFLQNTGPGSDKALAAEFTQVIETLISLLERSRREVGSAACSGLWANDGGELNLTDVMVGPWLFRATNVLRHYRNFILPESPHAWATRLSAHPAFAATCSTEDLYIDSYERYAFNRPNTSQVADAINTGGALP